MSEVVPGPDTVSPVSELDRELDQLSLAQALVDFERANARVVDLTTRLMEAYEEIESLRARNTELEHHLAAHAAAHAAIRSSRTYVTVDRIRRLRGLLLR